jgi:glucosylceramidase
MKPLLALILMSACIRAPHSGIRILETSQSGHRLTELTEFPKGDRTLEITLHPEQRFQTMTGFGGSFTEASASLLNRMSPAKRKQIIDAYFAD